MTSRLLPFMLIAAIVVAHIFLWLSDMELTWKVTFTTINAVAWTIVIAPVFLVDRWLDSVKRKNRESSDANSADR